jgi:hypothetical protein
VVFFIVNLAEMAIIHNTIEANMATQKKSRGNYIYIYLLMIHLYYLLPKWNLIQNSGDSLFFNF